MFMTGFVFAKIRKIVYINKPAGRFIPTVSPLFMTFFIVIPK